MLGVLAFLLGAVVGSFLNVVVAVLGGDSIAAWHIRLAGGFAL